jgi:hypothetical protein
MNIKQKIIFFSIYANKKIKKKKERKLDGTVEFSIPPYTFHHMQPLGIFSAF